MIRINRELFAGIVHSLDDIPFNTLFARSVLTGMVHGEVHADADNDPRLVSVAHPYGMSLLLAKKISDLPGSELLHYLISRRPKVLRPEFIQVFPEALGLLIDEQIARLRCTFPTKHSSSTSQFLLVKRKRINFSFNQAAFKCNQTSHFPSGHIDQLDESCFNTFTGSVVPRYFWNCYADFNKEGAGYVLRVKGEDAAIAFASFVHGKQLELGMETAEVFRRNGLATAVCARLINDCCDTGIEPVWACREDNTASFNLACRLGFEPIRTLPYYELRM